jgi:D-alanyl-D-alanine carboxypeptidase/D-alanyl-D-alanine-endopeptidase (penicillin-binding protein 4)
MKRFVAPSLTLLLLLTPSAVRADIAGDVKTVLMDKLLARASVGIEIVKLGPSEKASTIVFKHESDLPLIPASNLKLITTSAALDGLGADFRFRTVLARHRNDLVLIGDGDPAFGDAELLKKAGWDSTTIFRSWADALRKRGITKFENLIVDDSVFEENGIHKRWPAEQLPAHYSAEVAGLNLNVNCVDFYMITTGAGTYCNYRCDPPSDYLSVKNVCVNGGENAIRIGRKFSTNQVTLAGTCPQNAGVPVQVTVHDPSLFTGACLAEVLKNAGITMSGKVLRDRTVRAEIAKSSAASPASTEWQPIAVHETPIAQVLGRSNKDSVNLYAECLGKRLGFAVTGESGSWENGTAAVGSFLKKVGADESEFKLDDGCGLSKQNRISPNAIVHVLMYDYFGPSRQLFMDSLSVAGTDGTLEHRFANTDLRGRVFGKSGFVKGVSSLSGYLEAKNGEWYAFSILMNGIPDLSNSMIKPLQEAIVRSLDVNSAK